MTVLVLVSVVALQVIDAAGLGDEIGPPVTEESQPHEGEDLVEEPAPPPGRDWGEDAGAPDAVRAAAALRPDAVAPPAPAAHPGAAAARAPTSSAAVAPTEDAAARTGVLIAVLFLGIVALALATMVIVLRGRRRR